MFSLAPKRYVLYNYEDYTCRSYVCPACETPHMTYVPILIAIILNIRLRIILFYTEQRKNNIKRSRNTSKPVRKYVNFTNSIIAHSLLMSFLCHLKVIYLNVV